MGQRGGEGVEGGRGGGESRVLEEEGGRGEGGCGEKEMREIRERVGDRGE